MVAASSGIADADQGLVGGVINTSRQLGAAVGGAVDRAGHSSAAGDRAAMLAGAVAAGLATLVALSARPKSPPSRPASRRVVGPGSWPILLGTTSMAGGDIPAISFSSYLGAAVQRLYQEAVADEQASAG
jgi:hypothetical protein